MGMVGLEKEARDLCPRPSVEKPGPDAWGPKGNLWQTQWRVSGEGVVAIGIGRSEYRYRKSKTPVFRLGENFRSKKRSLKHSLLFLFVIGTALSSALLLYDKRISAEDDSIFLDSIAKGDYASLTKIGMGDEVGARTLRFAQAWLYGEAQERERSQPLMPWFALFDVNVSKQMPESRASLTPH